MKRYLNKKSILLFIVLILSIMISTIAVSAASYPLLSPDEYRKTAYVGDVVEIKYSYLPEYTNERIEVYVYNEKGKQVASSIKTFYHTSYLLDYTISWDTDGYDPGEYTVEAHKYFYTLNSWYEAPTTTKSYITLKSVNYCASDAHSYSYFTTTKEATCTENGSKQRECKNCPYVDAQVISATGHNYMSETQFTPTCTTAGQEKRTCSVCSDSYVVSIPALGHDSSYNITLQPTCITAGVGTIKCSRCTYNEVETIPATGHTAGVGQVIKEPTYATIGEMAYYCTVCGVVVKTEIIDRVNIPKVTSLKVSTVATTSIKLTWAEFDSADEYIVYYSTSGTSWKSVTSTTNSATVKSLTAGTNYQFKVSACLNGDEGEASSIVKTATKVAKVTFDTVSALLNGNISVSWKKVNGANGYDVEYSTSKDFTSSTTKKVTVSKSSTLKATLEKLTNGKKYYIRVRAYKTVDGKSVYGAYSAIKNITAKVSASISKTKATIYLGNKLTLNVLNANKKAITSGVTWKSSDKSVATVSKGVVTAKKAGTAKITATYKSVNFVCTVTVKSTVSVDKSNITIVAGSSKKHAITVIFKESGSVYYSIEKGNNIIDCEWSKKWNNSTTTLYISTDGYGYGDAKVKIYAKDNPNRYVYINVKVKPADENTVSVDKSKLTFKKNSTAKQAVTVTFLEAGSVSWEIIKGNDIINCKWDGNWENRKTKLYVYPDNNKYGEAKIKIYAVNNPEKCAYIDVFVEPPISLTIINNLPCYVSNYEKQDAYGRGEKGSTVKITNVDYEVVYGDSLKITVDFTAFSSYYDIGYYYFTYRVLDEKGYVIEFDRQMCQRMYEGDKSKEEFYIYDLAEGRYTIEFLDHYGNA